MALDRKRSTRRSLRHRGGVASSEQTKRPPASKCKNCCRQFIAFLFSHVGLCALVVAYAIGGAFMFKHLEAPFEMQIMEAIKDGYEGKKDNQQWSFSGAFLFSLTVISTIGYGNISPRTENGKIMTIMYAIIGIPLMLLYLTNIGDILAKAFRYVYGRLCTCKPDNARDKRSIARSRATKHSALQRSVSSVSPSAQRTPLHYTHSVPNSPVTTLNRHFQNTPLTPGSTVTLSDHAMVMGENAVHRNVSDLRMKSNFLPEYPNEFDVINEKPKEQTRVHVPITLCLIILTSYVCGGGVLFSLWEGWDYLDGSYFCFVTLSTIGFGDLVPGSSVVNDSGSQEKLVICSLYLLAGMALLAMCFNLMQEEVIHKVRNCGRRIGIIRDTEVEDDDEFDML